MYLQLFTRLNNIASALYADLPENVGEHGLLHGIFIRTLTLNCLNFCFPLIFEM